MVYFVVLLCTLAAVRASHDQPTGDCNYDLTYDAYLTFVGDALMQPSEFTNEMSKEDHDYLTPYCASQFRDLYGIETQPFFEGRGPLPDGWFGYNISINAYRVYSLSSREYPNNSPLTNGKVEDDTYTLFVTRDMTITQGSWLNMAIKMGRNLTWPVGSFITCGQYRVYQNSTDGSKVKAFPNVLYIAPMPMTSFWLGAELDFTNVEVSVNCDLFSSRWGMGRAIGMAHTEFQNGQYYARWRNTLSFPASIYDRPSMQGRIPENTACEPLQ